MNSVSALAPTADPAPQALPSAQLPIQLPGFLKRAASEPLLHFLLLGALVFGADHLYTEWRGNAQVITVDASVKREAREAFVAGMRREPSAADMKILVDRWVDNEVLYREGLAMGLDRGDASIRDRVIFKANSVTQAGLSLPRLDEPGLRAWFEAHRDKYDSPARFDFLEALVVGGGDAGAVKAFVDALNGGGGGSSDTQSSLRVFKDRPRPTLVQSYGNDFTAELEKLSPGQWHALASTQGTRVVRLESFKPGAVLKFDDVKETVYRDWKEETMAQLGTRAVRELGKKYQVRDEEVAP
jgi:hypothetical protein